MRYKWLCAQRFLGFISSIPCKWELPRGKHKSWASSKACFAWTDINCCCSLFLLQNTVRSAPTTTLDPPKNKWLSAQWCYPAQRPLVLQVLQVKVRTWAALICRAKWHVPCVQLSKCKITASSSSSSSVSASSSPLYQASPPPPPELLPPLSTTHLSND